MTAVDEIRKILEEDINFNKYQTDVLVYMLKQPNYQTAKQVAEGSGVPVFRVYSILDSLAEKGLVTTSAGKQKLFLIADASRINELIFIAKEKELREKEKLLEKACLKLREKLSDIQLSEGSEIIASYYVRPEDYWPVKAKLMEELQSNDSVKLIETNLSFLCFIGDQSLPKYFEQYVLKSLQAIKKSNKLWGLFINPEILVGAIIQQCKTDRKKVIKTLTKFLEFCSTHRNKLRVKCMLDIQNFTLSVIHDSVFIEFYAPYGVVPEFFIALKIKNKKVSDIFSSWLDMQFAPGGYAAEKEFVEVKNKILSAAKDIFDVKPSEVKSNLF